MSNTNVGSRPDRLRADFHLLQRHRWNETVVRIVKASRSTQQRMAEWSPELTRSRRHWMQNCRSTPSSLLGGLGLRFRSSGFWKGGSPCAG
jgi:hypothetical protein